MPLPPLPTVAASDAAVGDRLATRHRRRPRRPPPPPQRLADSTLPLVWRSGAGSRRSRAKRRKTATVMLRRTRRARLQRRWCATMAR